MTEKQLPAQEVTAETGHYDVQCNVCGFVYYGQVGLMCQSPRRGEQPCFGRMFIRPQLIDGDWRCQPDTEERERFIERCIADAVFSMQIVLDKQQAKTMQAIRSCIKAHLYECTNIVRAEQFGVQLINAIERETASDNRLSNKGNGESNV